MKLAALLAASPLVMVDGELSCRGQIPIGGGGGMVAHVKGGGISVSGNGLYINHDSGISLTTSCSEGPQDAWDPEAFSQFQLLGMSLSYYVDLSAVHCSCNLAFYLISAPARDPEGVPTFGECAWSPYYCDANRVCGQWCPELDIMEANIQTFAATPHTCDASPTPHFDNCDRGGKGQNTIWMGPAFGPGQQYTIDTTRPFQVRTSFPGSPGADGQPPQLLGMMTELRQDDRDVKIINKGGDAYLSEMAKAMDKGMSIRITYWGSDAKTMNWLDDARCGNDVCAGENAGQAIISDIDIRPVSVPPPPPPGQQLPPYVEPVPTPPPTVAPEPEPAPVPAPAPVPPVNVIFPENWTCHGYENGEDHTWCATIGNLDGLEYILSFGDGTCGRDCECCRRPVQEPAPIAPLPAPAPVMDPLLPPPFRPEPAPAPEPAAPVPAPEPERPAPGLPSEGPVVPPPTHPPLDGDTPLAPVGPRHSQTPPVAPAPQPADPGITLGMWLLVFAGLVLMAMLAALKFAQLRQEISARIGCNGSTLDAVRLRTMECGKGADDLRRSLVMSGSTELGSEQQRQALTPWTPRDSSRDDLDPFPRLEEGDDRSSNTDYGPSRGSSDELNNLCGGVSGFDVEALSKGYPGAAEMLERLRPVYDKGLAAVKFVGWGIRYSIETLRLMSRQRAANTMAFRDEWEKAGTDSEACFFGDLLRVGDRVWAQEDFSAPDVQGKKWPVRAETEGTVEQLFVADHFGCVGLVKFNGKIFWLSRQELDKLVVDTNSVTWRLRRTADITLLLAVLLVLAAVVAGLVALAHGGALQGASGIPRPDVPPEGCCSWDRIQRACGHTTQFCRDRSNCEGPCQGEWVMPL